MKNMLTKLAEKFIKSTRGQDLYPPVSSMSIFAPRISGYVFGGYYNDKTPAPYLAIMKKGKNALVFLSETKFNNLAREIFKKYWKNPVFLEKNARRTDHYVNILNIIYLAADYDYVNRASLGELTDKAKKTLAVNRRINTLFWFAVNFNEELCRQLLGELKVDIPENRFRQIWQKATAPAFNSFEQARYLYILHLLNKQINWPEIAEKCQYFFANYNLIADLKAAQKELYKKYGNISARRADSLLKESNNAQDRKISDYNKWLKSLADDEKKLAVWLQEIIKLRNRRKDAVSKALTTVYRIAQRMFKEADISENLILYCSCDEISRGINYLLKNKEKIKIRPRGIAMLFYEDKNDFVEFEYGKYDEIKRQLEKYYSDRRFFKKSDRSLNGIKGQIACSGQAKGKVRIVFDPAKVKNFTKGEILAVSMTRPEFTALIKKASAIITDEGGITCHAAIISRELNIPCIIGTRVATKILKDGDLVEVDADKGEVKIIKRAR